MGKQSRLFRRTRKAKNGRLVERSTWYADLRDIDGTRPSTGTDDYDEATQWLARKLLALESPSSNVSRPHRIPIAVFAEHHLEAKKIAGARNGTVERDAQSFRVFLAWAGQNITLGEVTPSLLNKYARHRRQKDERAPQTVLHELHALSSLYRRAVSEELVGANPVQNMVDKPKIRRRNGGVEDYLEPKEAAKFLAECEGDLHTLMAIGLYTGGRRAAICGLEWRDVDFERGLIRFRHNKWRDLKTEGGERVVPLWPDLRAILDGLDRSNSGLVVESPYGGMYKDVRGGIKLAAERAEVDKREINEKTGEPKGSRISWNTLRHTYATHRLDMIDRGAPVSPFKVAKELGNSISMIEKHYGHVLQDPDRGRAEVLEYKLKPEG